MYLVYLIPVCLCDLGMCLSEGVTMSNSIVNTLFLFSLPSHTLASIAALLASLIISLLAAGTP